MSIYTRKKDGRKMYYDTNTKTLYPYARYLMEQHLGRPLKKDEEVHHKDHDKTNDDINNLEVVNATEHRNHHNPLKYTDTIEQCYICGRNFTFTAKQHSNKYRERKRKPDTMDKYFCSRKCSGIYGKQIQASTCLGNHQSE